MLKFSHFCLCQYGYPKNSSPKSKLKSLPCGMPRRLSRAAVARFVRSQWSASSTAHTSHILIRCSTRRSTIRRASDSINSTWGVLPE